MATILRDSTVVVAVVVVVRTRPRAIRLAMINMRKSIHGFPLVSYMGMGLRLEGPYCLNTRRYFTDGRTNYTFSATAEIRTIHDHIDCNSKNLVYMIHCLPCNKQYIGETKRRVKDRFNEHRRPVDRPTPSSRPTAVSDHFLSDNHSPNDIELIPLELIHSSRDALRKAREAYRIERGKLLNPKV